MRKVMLFAHDPGGANAISPLIPEFESPLVFAAGPALDLLPGARSLPENALEINRPALLITGTSAGDFTERLLWKKCAFLKIPSMAILDMWANYGVRFSEYALADLHLFNNECAYCPDYICTMDKLSQDMLIREGVPAELILPFGNPHFEMLARYAEKVKASQPIRSKNKQVITFASQPFDDSARKGSELIVLEALLQFTNREADCHVIIRPHPKEAVDKFSRYLGQGVSIDSNNNAMSTIEASDMIVSVNSMVLIEAMFLGRKIISYQPRALHGKEDFILTHNDTIPFIHTTAEFHRYLRKIMDAESQVLENKILSRGTIERIVTFIREEICNV